MGNIPFGMRVALGREPGVSMIRKFGSNDDIQQSVETVWPEGGITTYRTTAIAMQISSDDATDTAAGDGARTVEIFGLDANYVEINETVILDGLTQVETTNLYLRVFRMIVRTDGSVGIDANGGIIYCGTGLPSPVTGKPSVVHCLISAGEGQTEVAFYTIPAGKEGLLCHYYLSEDSVQSLRGTVYARPLGETWQNKFRSLQRDTPFDISLDPICDMFEEKTDIEMRGVVGASTSAVSAGFTLFLFDKIGE